MDREKYNFPKHNRIKGYSAPRRLCSVCSETNTVDELIKKEAEEWAEGQFEKKNDNRNTKKSCADT
uniref:Uncharacterized protein n=1 Tax=Marseillevirus LCMAC101 TaxID=2506602 RepID=A0A481YQR6_9VIRU|nr:MAG: hypothetical protein LCMAC101_01190 [Marseillevirus LCMAC101]